MSLAKKQCTACEGIDKAFSRSAALKMMKTVKGWKISSNAKMISRDLVMKNFIAAVKLVDKIALIAENENHHPDIHLTDYRNLRIELSTHKLKGLTENDFIVAAKINELPLELKV